MCSVPVDSTKNPKPDGIAAVTPVIVISALSAKLPLVIVRVVPLGVKVVEAAFTLSTAAVPAAP